MKLLYASLDRTEHSAFFQHSSNVCRISLIPKKRYHEHLKWLLSPKLFPSCGGHKITGAEMRKRRGVASEVQEFLLSPSEHERFRDTQQ